MNIKLTHVLLKKFKRSNYSLLEDVEKNNMEVGFEDDAGNICFCFFTWLNSIRLVLERDKIEKPCVMLVAGSRSEGQSQSHKFDHLTLIIPSRL